MGRLIGLDYGTRRVGVAISDPSRAIATPVAVLEAGGDLAALDEILDDWEDVDGIVVGLPVSLSGEEGASAAAARSFGERVAAHTGLTVTFVDERYTSKVAEDVLIAGGARRAQRRDIRDKMAATVMLQSHLDSQR